MVALKLLERLQAVSKQRFICCVLHFSLADGVEQIKGIRESMLAFTGEHLTASTEDKLSVFRVNAGYPLLEYSNQLFRFLHKYHVAGMLENM